MIRLEQMQKPGSMITPLNKIDEKDFVADLVVRDYRTADVFKKYDIDYCCGAKWPLQTACEVRGLDTGLIKEELEQAIRTIHTSNALPFAEWPLDFLVDYIMYVHHAYLRHALPLLKEFLDHFIAEHRKKYAYLDELQQQFLGLFTSLPVYMKQQEETIFPYIKQVNRAWLAKEPFGGLLTRTLRKPVEKVMDQEHQLAVSALLKFRELTNNYTLPVNACKSHRVVFMKLIELDNDLVQHLYLENKIILPRLLTIEKELSKQ